MSHDRLSIYGPGDPWGHHWKSETRNFAMSAALEIMPGHKVDIPFSHDSHLRILGLSGLQGTAHGVIRCPDILRFIRGTLHIFPTPATVKVEGAEVWFPRFVLAAYEPLMLTLHNLYTGVLRLSPELIVNEAAET